MQFDSALCYITSTKAKYFDLCGHISAELLKSYCVQLFPSVLDLFPKNIYPFFYGWPANQSAYDRQDLKFGFFFWEQSKAEGRSLLNLRALYQQRCNVLLPTFSSLLSYLAKWGQRQLVLNSYSNFNNSKGPIIQNKCILLLLAFSRISIICALSFD